MAATAPLFILPVAPSGTIICNQVQAKVYILVFNCPPDNRLTPELCKAFLLALDIIDLRLPKGVVVTTSAIAKFYSNGLDLERAIATEDFFEKYLYPLWRRLLT